MANNISLHKVYLKSLDKIYQNECLTSILDTEQIDSTKEAKTFTIDKMEMDGLSDYSRANGYVNGDVTLTQEEKSPNYDRGKKFSVDEMDDVESGYIAFGKLSGEFERTKAIPELDAFRIAKYASKAGLAGYGSVKTPDEAISAVETAEQIMGDKEVPSTNLVMFVSNTFYNLLRKGGATRFSDVNDSKINRKLEEFDDMKIVKVPASRFYTICELGDKGYKNKGLALDFLIVEKSAVMQFQKHKASNVISPEDNQNADAYILKYRNYGLAEVYDNKAVGIYAHAPRQAVALTIKATDTDGEVAGATLTVKSTSSSGTAITANTDGSYTIPADVNKVYIKVEKTGYTSVTETFDIEGVDNIAGARLHVVKLEKSA